MKKKSMTLISVLMALAIAFCAAVPSFAEKAVFDNTGEGGVEMEIVQDIGHL